MRLTLGLWYHRESHQSSEVWKSEVLVEHCASSIMMSLVSWHDALCRLSQPPRWPKQWCDIWVDQYKFLSRGTYKATSGHSDELGMVAPWGDGWPCFEANRWQHERSYVVHEIWPYMTCRGRAGVSVVWIVIARHGIVRHHRDALCGARWPAARNLASGV